MYETIGDSSWPGRPGAAALLKRVVRLTDLLSRLRLNYQRLLRKENDLAIQQAAASCHGCQHTAACGRWLELHEEGQDNPAPWFCPALSALGVLARSVVIARDRRAQGQGVVIDETFRLESITDQTRLIGKGSGKRHRGRPPWRN